MWKGLVKETAEIVADIKGGEIMSIFATIYGFVFIGAAVYYISQGDILVGGALFCLTPISFFVLAIGVKLLLSRFTKDLNSLDGEDVKDDFPKPVGQPAISELAQRFSSHLEKIKKERMDKGDRFTGLGLAFLNEIKSAPPFLGLRNEKPVISTSDEQKLTEFFMASIYMDKYRNVIKGGRYQIRKDDDENTIAKNIYGDEKYKAYVPTRYVFSMGSILELPYVNLERPDSNEFIRKKMKLSNNIEEIKSMLESYQLVRDESIPILRIVYDAAQKTLEG